MIRKIMFAVLLGATLCVAQTKPGDIAPQFTVKSLAGKSVSLSDFKGKVVLLNFWATWCEPCQTEIPRFIEFQRQYRGKGFQVVGISMDDSDVPVRRFTAKLRTNYPVAIGNAKIAESYGGILGLPITLLIDRRGHIAKRYEGIVDLDSMQRDVQLLLAEGNDVSEHDHSKQR